MEYFKPEIGKKVQLRLINSPEAFPIHWKTKGNTKKVLHEGAPCSICKYNRQQKRKQFIKRLFHFFK